MNLSNLLQQREALLRQARLANVAYAYRRFGDFAARIASAGLRGEVHLQPTEPWAERYWPTLTTLDGNQSVIEEHFTEEDIMELADVLAFVTGTVGAEYRFRLEDLEDVFVAPLRRELVESGVVLEETAPPSGELNRHG